jgi:hypothetical protein
MKAPQTGRRTARLSHDYLLMLAMMLIVCIAVVRILTPDQGSDPRPLWERLVSSLVGLLQCFGLCIGACILLASLEALKQTVSRYHVRRIEKRRECLEPILQDAREHASSADLGRVTRFLTDGNDTVRRHAFGAAYAIIRHNPAASDPASHRPALYRALLDEPGFSRTLAETPLDDPLLPRVTLGAKLGAGSADKRLAPPTSDPTELALWVELHRREHDNPEIQVSIGYDTGSLPYLGERSRFVALSAFVATTDLQKFQALVRRPPRDPNAAYGLVIRGDVVEVRYPGQARGHRLDYVFPLPTRLSTANLAAFFRDLQLLNLGLLAACADDAARVLLGGAPPWLDARRRAVGALYRAFERDFVALLRRYDRCRDREAIHALVPSDHGERQRAFLDYRLEECLYPQYSWVVPLYDPDTRWDRLLDPLRAVEGMLLHQGEAEEGGTVGSAFIRAVRRLGYECARSIEQALEGDCFVPVVPPDPFLDPAEVEATRHYLRRVGNAITQGEAWAEDVPDPETFRRAADYYEIRTKDEARKEVPS